MTRALSLAYMTVAELSPPEAVRAAHAAGYDSVDLRLHPVTPADRIHDLSPSSAVLRDTLSCLAETGISVFDIELIRLTRELDVATLMPLVDAASRLGARRIKVAGADPDPTVVIERMAQICELVDPLGIVVDLEFMMFSSVRTLDDAARVTAATRCRNAGILIDALHLSRSGGTLPTSAGSTRPASATCICATQRPRYRRMLPRCWKRHARCAPFRVRARYRSSRCCAHCRGS